MGPLYYTESTITMRIVLLIIAALAIAAASTSIEDDRIPEDVFASAPTGSDDEDRTTFPQDNLLQDDEREETFAEASSKLETHLLQLENQGTANAKGKVAAKAKISVEGAKGGFNANFYADVRNLRNVGQ